LLKLDTISSGCRQFLVQISAERDVVALDLTSRHRNDAEDDLIDIEPGHLDRGFLGQSSNTVNHDSGSLAIVVYARQRLADLIKVGRRSIQPAPAHAGAHDYSSERLVYFVGDRGGELPQRHDASDVREFRAELVHLLLRSRARCDLGLQ